MRTSSSRFAALADEQPSVCKNVQVQAQVQLQAPLPSINLSFKTVKCKGKGYERMVGLEEGSGTTNGKKMMPEMSSNKLFPALLTTTSSKTEATEATKASEATEVAKNVTRETKNYLARMLDGPVVDVTVNKDELQPGWVQLHPKKNVGTCLDASVASELDLKQVNRTFNEIIARHKKHDQAYINLHGYEMWEYTFKYPGWDLSQIGHGLDGESGLSGDELMDEDEQVGTLE